MTETIILGAFCYGIAYICGIWFRGLNPFLMLVSIVFGLAMAVQIFQFGLFYQIVFIFGFINAWLKPFKIIRDIADWISCKFTQYRYNRKFNRSQRNRDQFSDAHNSKQSRTDNNEQARQQAEEQAQANERAKRQAEEKARQYEEELKRERARANQNQEQTKKETVDNRTPEQILGLKLGYTQADLKKAYKTQCARLHPDRWMDKPKAIQDEMLEEMKKVNGAYEKLKR